MKRTLRVLVTWLQIFYFFQFHETAPDPETRATGLIILAGFTSPPYTTFSGKSGAVSTSFCNAHGSMRTGIRLV